MTLPSRHGIRNSTPGGLRPNTRPIGHRGPPQYWISQVDGEETFLFFFKPPRTGNEQPNPSVKGSGANHYPRAAAQQIYKFIDQRMLYRGKLVLKQWTELNVSLLPNDEKTCIQSLIHNLKSYSFCVHVSTIHTVTSRDVWRPWHILFNRDL